MWGRGLALGALLATVGCATAPSDGRAPRSESEATGRAPVRGATIGRAGPSPVEEEGDASSREGVREGPSRAGGPGGAGATTGRYTSLAVAEGYPPLVWVPGGGGPHPVLFAAHGAGGQAEHHCEYWRELTRETTLLVCLRGEPLFRTQPGRGFYYANHHALEAETQRAVAALEEQFAGLLSPVPWTFAGYSQGATMGALMLVEHGDRFARLALLEGGTEGWSVARAQRFFERGGRRVLFVCGGERCQLDAERAAGALQRGGLEVRARLGAGAGHTYLGAVREQVRSELGWLLGPLD